MKMVRVTIELEVGDGETLDSVEEMILAALEDDGIDLDQCYAEEVTSG